jgi:hypothetical protein
MIPIQTTVTVAPDGKAAIELPSNILPGEHKVLLIMEEQSISTQPVVNYNAAWDEFEQLIDKSTVDTEIEDMAHQHDHYIHGTLKRDT